MTASIRVHEIFHSLQGETSRTGLPTSFIRLTGCPLRCGYCDTEYAFHGGSLLSVDAILERIRPHEAHHVCVTGGEPLAQKPCLQLLTALCDAGYSVSLETSGAMDISPVDPRVSRIVDIKTPGSGEVAKNRWQNLEILTPQDEVKFVLVDAEDYSWALDVMARYDLARRCPVLFSPVYGQLRPSDLAEWILRDRVPARMQVQLHKILWGETPGR